MILNYTDPAPPLALGNELSGHAAFRFNFFVWSPEKGKIEHESLSLSQFVIQACHQGLPEIGLNVGYQPRQLFLPLLDRNCSLQH